MNNIYTIYKATNKINGKSYIGFDSNWPNRQLNHIKDAYKCKYDSIFHRAIRKYGNNSFNWEILSQSKDGDYTLNILEPHFIKECNTFGENGYNMTLGGEGILGYKHNKETKKKIGISSLNNTNAKGLKVSIEHRKKLSKLFSGENNPAKKKGVGLKISKAKTGFKYTQESKLKMSMSHIGKKHSSETKEKMSISRMGKKYKKRI